MGALGVSAMFVGLVLGVAGSKIGGTRRMLYVAPGLGVAAGLGAFTAYDWWWVALLAVVGVIAGAGIGFGWFARLADGSVRRHVRHAGDAARTP